VRAWPLVKVEIETEDLALEKTADLNTFFLEGWKDLVEQEAGGHVVLVFDHVAYNYLTGADLVVFQSVLDRILVFVLFLHGVALFNSATLNFVSVDDGELVGKVFCEFVAEELFH
jgi:hypothetical protein